MDAKGKVTINVNTSHNGKRFCFWVLDRVGNEGFNDLEIGANEITKKQPELVVNQTGNRLDYRNRSDNLAYSGPHTSEPNCNIESYTLGRYILEEEDSNQYYCFRAGTSASSYSYAKLQITTVDKTPPVINIVQEGNRITAKYTNSETNVRWMYFKTTTTAELTDTACENHAWNDTKKRALGSSVVLAKADSNKWICFRGTDAAGNSNHKKQQISPITDDTTAPVTPTDPTKAYVAPPQTVRAGSVVDVTKTNLPAGAKVATAATAAGSWVWVYNDKDLACNSSHEHYKRLKDRKRGQVGQSPFFSFSQFQSAKSVCFLGIDTSTKREYFVGYRISSDGSTTPPATTPEPEPKDDTVKQIVASLPSGVTAVRWGSRNATWVWVYTSDAPHACNRDNPLYQTHIKPQSGVGSGNKIDPNKWTDSKAFCVVAVGNDGNEYFFSYDRLGNATGTDVQTLDGSNVTPTPDPGPGGEETPDPGPGGEETPDPGPGGEETPDPGPGGEETPDPGPGGEETPDPGPGGEETPDPGPGGEETPDPGPGDGSEETPDPGDDEEGGSNIIWFIVAGVAIVAIIIVLITTSGSRQQRRE